MALQGFDKDYYLQAKLDALVASDPTEWGGKDAADLTTALADVGLTPEQHYAAYGYTEGLAPNAYFNAEEYSLAKATLMVAEDGYATIEAAQAALTAAWPGNLYDHYLQYGAAEGVNPSNAFDESGYYDAKLVEMQKTDPNYTLDELKQAFTDAGLTALSHYELYGKDEGVAVVAVPADEQVDTGGSTPNPGETFTLTTGVDTFIGTAGDDVFTGTSADIAAGDTIIDQSSTDNDTFNMTLTAANAAMKVVGVENVNVDWDAFGTAAIDASNIDTATITVTSAKTGFLGNLNVTAGGDNTVVAGSGMVGTTTVTGVTDGVVTGTNATKLVVDALAASGVIGDSVSVTAGANTTTTTVGGTTKFLNATVTDGAASTTLTVNADNATVNASTAKTISVTATAASTTAGTTIIDAAQATSITVSGTAATTDALSLTTGVSTALDLTGTLVDNVTLNAADATTVTLAAGSAFTTLDSTSAATTTLAAAAIADLNALTVTNSGAGTLKVSSDASTALAAVDLSKVAATQFDFTGTVAAQNFTFATGANVNLDKDADLNSATAFLADGTATTDTLNMSVANDLTNIITVLGATNDIETLNLTVDLDQTVANAVGDLAGITGTNVTLTSTDDVTIAALVADSLDATNMTGNLIVTDNAVATESTIVGGSGNNTLTFSSVANTDTVAVIGNVGDDSVTFTGGIIGTTTGAEASLVLSDGDNTVTGNTVTDAVLSVTGGAGDDTVTATLADTVAAADTQLVASLGDGTNSVSINTNSGGVEYAQVTTGAGDDTLVIAAATAGADVIKWDAGTGTNTLDLSAGVDVTSATFTLTGVDNILVKTGEASIMDATFLSDTDYNIVGSGANTDGNTASYDDQIAVVNAEAGAASFNYSDLTFGSGITNGASGVKFTASANNSTVIGSIGADEFIAGGVDSFDGGLGVDTYSLAGAGAIETIINTNIDKNSTDVVDKFTTTEDVLTYSVADLNALTGATTFAVGDVVGTDSGAFVEFLTSGGNVAASGTAGTFIFDADNNILYFDESGDTLFVDGTGITDTSGDDIAIIGLTTTTGTGAVVAADIALIA